MAKSHEKSLLNFLDAETAIKDVVYDPVNAATVVNKDGSITLSMPSSIGEISFEHIRVRGSSGPGFDSIYITGIDLLGMAPCIGRHPSL